MFGSEGVTKQSISFTQRFGEVYMAVRLRLAMHGRRHNRIFHLVAMNQRASRDSKPIEKLGTYDPRLHLGQEHKTMQWSVQRIKYWLKSGALPSKPVVKLLELVSILYSARSDMPEYSCSLDRAG
jgi:small subunit ribosomal protein S16